MKKRVVSIIILMMVLAATGSFASEDLDIFSYLYDAANSTEDQLGILLSVSEMQITGAGTLYARAIARLAREYPPTAFKNLREIERDNADELAILLAGSLGNEKQLSAARDLWTVMNNFPNPLVKSEVLMALGKMRATDYLPHVIKTLEDLNQAPTRDRLEGERVAFGAIVSLEKYKDKQGYLPVFFASTGWYSQRIKDQAALALPEIQTDPTDQMLLVEQGARYSINNKLIALRNMGAAKVSDQSKASVAVAALSSGWNLNPTSQADRREIVTLRKEAMAMIDRYGTTDTAVYNLLGKSYNNGVDSQEKLTAIQTLTNLKTEQSAQYLTGFLNNLNQKQRSGTATQEDNNLVRAIIPAVGTLAHPNSRSVLMAVESSNWPAAVVTLSKDALAKIR